MVKSFSKTLNFYKVIVLYKKNTEHQKIERERNCEENIFLFLFLYKP